MKQALRKYYWYRLSLQWSQGIVKKVLTKMWDLGLKFKEVYFGRYKPLMGDQLKEVGQQKCLESNIMK